MENKPKKWFTGNGPFSSINKFTTRIQMIKAAELLGIPFDHDEFVDGVLNAEKIISDGNFLKENA